MNTESHINPEQMASAAAKASELMKTLGHKDRLMILCHLVSGEKSVGELARLLEIPQSPLSQHTHEKRESGNNTARGTDDLLFHCQQ